MGAGVSSWLLGCVNISDSTMHELHFSTQAEHSCHSCLISNAVYLDKLKLHVQTNWSWPRAGLGLLLLEHKLFVCFLIDITAEKGWWPHVRFFDAANLSISDKGSLTQFWEI